MSLSFFVLDRPTFNKVAVGFFATVFASTGLNNLPAEAITKDQLLSLSYLQVKGTGLANRCPEVVGESSIQLSSGKKYKVVDLCLEPTTWKVRSKNYIFPFV
jgi:photosystem II oxygen-evolving enhancer protein 1